MVKVAIEKPRISTSLRRRTLAGIDTAIRLTNSQKAEFIVHPATGGTSSGQKRGEFTTLFARGDGLSAFLYIFHFSVLYCEHATQEIVLLSFGAFHF